MRRARLEPARARHRGPNQPREPGTRREPSRDGRFVERLGTYNPLLPRDHDDRLVLKSARINYSLGKGARPTDRVHKMLAGAGLMEAFQVRDQPKKSAPGRKRQEREADAAEAAAAAAAEAEAAAEAPVEEAPAEEAVEAPAEEAAAEETAEAPADEAAEDTVEA